MLLFLLHFFNQINATLLIIRGLFQKHLKKSYRFQTFELVVHIQYI